MKENEFYIPRTRVYEVADPDNNNMTIEKKSQLTTFEPTEKFEPFCLTNCEHSFGLVANCSTPYVRVIDKQAGADGEIGWTINAAGRYAESQTFRDTHRPIVTRGLAALLLANARFVRNMWRIDTKLISMYRQCAEEGVPFSEKELKTHQSEERKLWQDSMDEAKRWLPAELFDVICRTMQSYCNANIVDPDTRDERIVKALGGDTAKYDLLVELCLNAKRVSDYAKALKIVTLDISLMGFVRLMKASGRFPMLENGKTLMQDYKKIYKAMRR